MKTLITLSLLSAVLAACGNSNLNTESVLGLPGSGVTTDGRCDSTLIATRALMTRDLQAQNYDQFDKDCKSYAKKYPRSECRALDVDAGNKEIKLKTADDQKNCVTIHDRVHGTPPPAITPPAVTQNPAPAPVTPPAPAPVTPPAPAPSTPVSTVDTGTCAAAFIQSYTLIGQDLAAIQVASTDQTALIKAGEKLNADCKTFVATYPATVCKAQNADKSVVTVDSREIQPVCKKFADYMNSLVPSKPTPNSTDLSAAVQSIEL